MFDRIFTIALQNAYFWGTDSVFTVYFTVTILKLQVEEFRFDFPIEPTNIKLTNIKIVRQLKNKEAEIWKCSTYEIE